MSKNLFKVILLALFAMSGVLMYGGGHASADYGTDCSDPAIQEKWGVHAGPMQNHLAGAVVHAYESGNESHEYNVSFTLTARNYDGTRAQNIGNVWNDQKVSQKRISTGDPFGNNGSPSNPEPHNMQCDGYAVYGYGWDGHLDGSVPGSRNWGNGWVLDCGGLPKKDPQKPWLPPEPTPINWQITDVPEPGNGRWELWDVIDGNPVRIDKDVNRGPVQDFHTHNGTTEKLDLVWVAEPPPPPQPVNTVTCNYASFDNGGTYVNPNTGEKRPTRRLIRILNVSDVKINGFQKNGDNIDGDIPEAYAPWPNGSTNVSDKATWTFTPNQTSIAVGGIQQWQGAGGEWHDIGSWGWYDGNGGWVLGGGPTGYPAAAFSCIHANCSITSVVPVAPVPGMPNFSILAGQRYRATVFIADQPQSGAALNPLPGTLLGAPLSLTGGGGGQFTTQPVGGSVGTFPDGFRGVEIEFDAPGGLSPFNVSFYPDYYNINYNHANSLSAEGGKIGDWCSVTVTPYKHFSLTPYARTSLTKNGVDNDENPDSVQYHTGASVAELNSGEKVNVSAQSCVYKDERNPANCSGLNIRSFGPGTFTATPPGTDNLTGPSSISQPKQAGDEYCAYTYLYYTGGYVDQNGGVILPTGGGPASGCSSIKNKPYFKVYGNSVSAGGGYKGSSCDSGGVLGGWNDNTGLNRGAGTQLSALAMIKITGFASAQTYGAKGSERSFANTGINPPVGTGAYSPDLGGSFGGSRCFTQVSPPDNATPMVPGSTATAGSGSGSATYSGPTIVNGGVIGRGTQQSIFVEGNVYIRKSGNSNGITYDTGWNPTDKNDVPSFVLHATGNIYIDPAITELDGLYIAQDNAAGGGKIYTCGAASYTPVKGGVGGNFYDTCKNQLVVHGAFVANQVNLMRTLGSLRDAVNGEIVPHNGSGGGAQKQIVSVDPSVCDWEPVPVRGQTAIRCKGSSVTCLLTDAGRCQLESPDGVSFCDFDGDPRTPLQCYQVQIASGPKGGIPSPIQPCSNDPNFEYACAAEVFDFSPEFFLSSPVLRLSGNGALQYDAITSLPPVL